MSFDIPQGVSGMHGTEMVCARSVLTVVELGALLSKLHAMPRMRAGISVTRDQLLDALADALSTTLVHADRPKASAPYPSTFRSCKLCA